MFFRFEAQVILLRSVVAWRQVADGRIIVCLRFVCMRCLQARVVCGSVFGLELRSCVKKSGVGVFWRWATTVPPSPPSLSPPNLTPPPPRPPPPPPPPVRLCLGSLSEQQRRQQRQLQEFFVGVDVLASTETSAPLPDTTDSALEGMFASPGDGDDSSPRARSGLDWVVAGAGAGVAAGAYGSGAGEEGTAAVAVRKSVYHLRQLRQVRRGRKHSLVARGACRRCSVGLAAMQQQQRQQYCGGSDCAFLRVMRCDIIYSVPPFD